VIGAFKNIGRTILLLTWCTVTSFGQNVSKTSDSTVIFRIRAIHLLGFEGAGKSATGALSVQDRMLRFQKGNEPAEQVMITSVNDVYLGDESKQVGGLPMTLGKAAVPFGGGRVVSLFAHKKYDTVTLEYVASNGAIHGAIFELSKGQGKLLRDHLISSGAHVTHNDESKQRLQGASR
jgi:hypothetical protein